MLNRLKSLLIILLILMAPLEVFGQSLVNVNNPGFEDSMNSNNWIGSSWDKSNGASTMYIDNKVHHSGEYSALIINDSLNDSRYIQDVKVESNTYYKISCYIKTQGVGTKYRGANISIEYIAGTSRDIKGTSDWTKVELYGKTGINQNNFLLTLGLGGYSSTNSGKAWFDDVTIEKLNSMPKGVTSINFYNDSDNTAKPTTAKSIGTTAIYIFMILMILSILSIYFVFIYKKTGDTINTIIISLMDSEFKKRYLFVLTCLLGIVLRLIFAFKSKGFEYDLSCFRGWAYWAAKDLHNFYNMKMFTDYPPLYMYVLAILGKLVNVLNIGQKYVAQNALMKIPSMTADLASAVLLYKLCKKNNRDLEGIVIAGIYIFNPMVIFNSSIWGQVDSFFTFFIIIALMELEEDNTLKATIFLALAVLIKPQGIIFLPILFYKLIRKMNISEIILLIGVALGVVILVILPFSFNQKPFWIIKLYIRTITEYPYAAMNALNLFSFLGGNFVNGSEKIPILGFKLFVSYKMAGLMFIFIITIYVGFLWWKAKNVRLPAMSGLILITLVFVLSSGMHERYMFPAAALALICYIYIKDIRFIIIYACVSITGFMNTFIVYEYNLININVIPKDSLLSTIIAILNILCAAFLIKASYDIGIKDRIITKFIKSENDEL